MKIFQDIIKNFSIRKKLMMLSMVTSTIAVIITCTGFVFFTMFEERNELVSEVIFLGKILSEDISSSIHNKDYELANKALQTLRLRDNLIQACVYNNQGKEFIHFPENNLKKPCNKLPKLNKRFEFFNEGFFSKYLIVRTEIKNNDKKYGSLYTLSTLDRINEKILRSLYNSIILFSIILGISYIISRNLQKNISDPIVKLADVSYAVKSGDYDIRAKHNSYDEVGELTEAFNDMLNVIQDSRDNLEKKVKKRTRDLEKAMRIKSDFLSNMSHEIRTPIHGIMNYADFLVNDWQELDENKRYSLLKKLHSNSNRLLSLINNLLDLSKLNDKKLEFFFEDINIIELIHDIISEVEPLYIEKDINIIFNQKKPIICCFDKERIAQVIRNLLSNAIKFMKKGSIEVEVKNSVITHANNQIKALLISIKDQGIGIPENELSFIFDKFNQSGKTKTGAGGTGLGLTISRDIVRFHNGEIWAENNNDNMGACFFVKIPLEQSKKGNSKLKKESILSFATT